MRTWGYTSRVELNSGALTTTGVTSYGVTPPTLCTKGRQRLAEPAFVSLHTCRSGTLWNSTNGRNAPRKPIQPADAHLLRLRLAHLQQQQQLQQQHLNSVVDPVVPRYIQMCRSVMAHVNIGVEG